MKIFISHNHADKDFVLSIKQELTAISDSSLLIWHSENLPLGMNWKDEIEYRMENADSFIVLLSANYLSSNYATYELGRLLQIQKIKKKPVIPLVIQPLNIANTPISDIAGYDVSNKTDLAKIAPRIIEATKKSIEEQLPIDCGEVYLKYEVLELDVISGIMYSIKNIYYLLYNQCDEKHFNKNKRRVKKQDRLILYTSETGESIRFKVKTGWVPRITTDGEDIILESPKSVITLLASFYLLSLAIENTTSSYKDILEIIKTNNEIEMQSLQGDKLILEIEKLKKELRNTPPRVRENIEREVHHFLRHTVHNNDIKSLRLKTRHIETEQVY